MESNTTNGATKGSGEKVVDLTQSDTEKERTFN